jgi:hypothetical protein
VALKLPKKQLVLACILAGCFAFLPSFASEVEPLPISIDTTYVNITANPGERIEKSFKFWNGTDAYLPLHLEAVDFAAQGEEGQIVVDGSEDAVNSLKTWVTPDIPDLQVAPKQDISLGLAIDVPVNADPGSHWGTLLSITAPQSAGSGPGIGVQARLGFIIYIRVLGEAREKLTLESFSVPKFTENPRITLAERFRNEGTVHEAPVGNIEVRNVFGALVATGTLPVRNVLPGLVRKVEGSVGEGFWFGRYTVNLSATYGDNGEKLSATRAIWVIPWRKLWPWALLAVVLVALAVVARKRIGAALYVLRTGKVPP